MQGCRHGAADGKTTGASVKRKTIGAKTRFEVFKRDGFKCQYCGRSAPDVILHVDHVEPVSKGGTNDILNLITSCFECNGGKGATRLDDQAALIRQRQQLEELNQRREQLHMMVKWRKELGRLKDEELEAAQERFSEIFEGFLIESDGAVAKLRKLIRSFGLNAVLEAFEIAREQYAPSLNSEEVNLAWSKVGGICNNRSKPDDSDLYYVRGIVRKRMYCHEGICISLLRKARGAGIDGEALKDIARDARNWTAWQDAMQEAIVEAQG